MFTTYSTSIILSSIVISFDIHIRITFSNFPVKVSCRKHRIQELNKVSGKKVAQLRGLTRSDN